MTKKSDILTKKGLKNFINENGFFIHVRELEKIDANAAQDHLDKLDDEVKTKVSLPKETDNIQVFRGLASQYYGKGKKSRNGYKYDHKGIDLTNYKKKPLILLQHDSSKPIGFALSLEVKDGVGMEILYFVDYNTKAAKENEHEIRNGYIGMLSTGAITREWKVEDAKTGELMTPEEAAEAGVDLWAVLFGASEDYIMVVTEAELIENSQVTIGSNEDAQTKGDSLGNFFTNQLEKMNIPKTQTDAAEEAKKINSEEGAEPTEPTEEPVEPTEEAPEEGGEEPTNDPEQPEGEPSEPETAENDGGNPEGGEDAPENGDEVPVAEGDEEPGEPAENADEPTDEPEGEDEEPSDPEEEPGDAEAAENELLEATKALAKNLLSLEDEFSKSKGALKADEVNALIDEKLNNVIADQNAVIEKAVNTVVILSNTVKELNTRLDKVAVNKPKIVHRQLQAATKKKKDTWA